MISMRESVVLIWEAGTRPKPRSENLGKLVQFETKSKAADSGRPSHSSSAEILIFTGVRYERDIPVTPTKPTASPRAKRKRG
jgi:hypothetical protein